MGPVDLTENKSESWLRGETSGARGSKRLYRSLRLRTRDDPKTPCLKEDRKTIKPVDRKLVHERSNFFFYERKERKDTRKKLPNIESR